MSIANKISIARILLVPVIVASLLYYSPERDGLRFVAFGVFVLGILSDALDGFLARLWHQESELGTILDPIADKALILSALISCSTIHGLPAWMRVPAWFNLIVISRDVLLISGSVLLFILKGRWSVRPSRLGKWTTFMQMMVVPSVLLGWPVTGALLLLAATCTVCSAVGYVRTGIRALD